MTVREFVDLPVVLVEAPAEQPATEEQKPAEVGDPATHPDTKSWQVHVAHASESALKHFHWGHNRLATSAQIKDDESTIAQRLAFVADSFDLAEPFVRIREAIEEARRAGGC